MAGVYRFTIEAIDKSTAVARKIRAGFTKVGEPFSKLGNSLKAFGKESGLDNITKSTSYLGKTLGGAAAKAGGFASEFETIASLGGRAGVAGVIAGVAATVGLLGVKWANFGFDVKRTAMMLGTSTLAVQQWRGAAAGMGIDASETDASMQALGDTLQDAFAGRNNAALFLFQRLHMQMKRTKTGAVDVNEEMLQLADVLARFKGNPEVQRLIARTFGVDPKMIPLLEQGRKVVQQQQKDAARFALSDKEVEDAAKLDRFFKRSGVQAKAFFYKAGSWVFEGLKNGGSLFGGAFTGLSGPIGGLVNILLNLKSFSGRIERMTSGVSELLGILKDGFTQLLDFLTGGSGPKGSAVGTGSGIAANAAIAAGRAAIGSPPKDAPEGPSRYMSGAEFSAMMDKVFGKGRWRQTGGWRSQATENWLRAHGAQTVRRGFTSAHSRGTGDAPGARDVQIPGISARQAALMLREHGYNIRSLFPEGRAGNQGPHLHIGMAPLPVVPSGSVQVDVKVRHDGTAAAVTTKASGGVQAKGKVEKSMTGPPA